MSTCYYGQSCNNAITTGRRGDCMYFIEHGLAEVRLPNGQVVKELKDGDHFGGILFFR